LLKSKKGARVALLYLIGRENWTRIGHVARPGVSVEGDEILAVRVSPSHDDSGGNLKLDGAQPSWRFAFVAGRVFRPSDFFVSPP